MIGKSIPPIQRSRRRFMRKGLKLADDKNSDMAKQFHYVAACPYPEVKSNAG